MTAPSQYWCSFCGKDSGEADVLVAGPVNVMICPECVTACIDSIAKKRREFRLIPNRESPIFDHSEMD